MEENNELDGWLSNLVGQELIKLSFNKKIKIHIILKDKTWRNGFVTKILPDFFMFEDMEDGEEPFFYIQLYNVEPFMERGEK
jgi:hypothetical protein